MKTLIGLAACILISTSTVLYAGGVNVTIPSMKPRADLTAEQKELATDAFAFYMSCIKDRADALGLKGMALLRYDMKPVMQDCSAKTDDKFGDALKEIK